MNIIAAGLGTLGILQTEELFHKSQSVEQSRHEIELELTREQHRKQLLTAKQMFLINTFTDIEQYCQELNENLISSTRDSERDMVDQRNQQFQTILVASTIMLLAIMNILVQSSLPLEANQAVKIAFAVSNAGSILFIVLNTLFCVQLIYRVTQFMYRKSEATLLHLSDATSATKTMMRNLYGEIPPKDNKNISSSYEYYTENIYPRSHLSKLSTVEVDNQWNRHETEIHAYLLRRNNINEKRESIRFGATTFEKFWHEECEFTGFIATICYYIGTALMLVSTMLYVWATYICIYDNLDGGIINLVTISSSLLFCIAFVIYIRYDTEYLLDANGSYGYIMNSYKLTNWLNNKSE